MKTRSQSSSQSSSKNQEKAKGTKGVEGVERTEGKAKWTERVTDVSFKKRRWVYVPIICFSIAVGACITVMNVMTKPSSLPDILSSVTPSLNITTDVTTTLSNTSSSTNVPSISSIYTRAREPTISSIYSMAYRCPVPSHPVYSHAMSYNNTCDYDDRP